LACAAATLALPLAAAETMAPIRLGPRVALPVVGHAHSVTADSTCW
jgi:hypothetical protein